MKNTNTIIIGVITFLFLTVFAEPLTDKLPKEFFDNADLYAKLDMIENLTVLEKISENDLQANSQQSDASASEVSP